MEYLEQIKSKITTIDDFERIIDSAECKSKKIVFTNGCFDIIHAGHVAYLAEARSLGDLLVIGLNTDCSVKRLKGENRPVNSEKARAIVLAAMQFVDFIILFDEDTPYNLINKIKPNVLVKGGDYKLSEIVGADIVLENGGIVKTITFVNGYSTTNILEKIKNEKS